MSRSGKPWILGMLVPVIGCSGQTSGQSSNRLGDAAYDGTRSEPDAGAGARGGSANDSGRDSAGDPHSDSATDAPAHSDASGDAVADAHRDTGSEPFTPAAGCSVPPEAGAEDAAQDAALGEAGPMGGDASGCVYCQPQYVTRVVGSNVFVTDTYDACCATDGGRQTCGVVVGGECHPRNQAGTPDLACPNRCCRTDGTCGAQRTSLGLGCVASSDPNPPTCRAASGPHPGECACGSCAEQIAACAASVACTAIVACRAGRSSERPGDRDGYALADALDSCLQRSGCARLPAVGLCRGPCPSGWAGGVSIQVELHDCCRADGVCGVKYQDTCILYDDPLISHAPRSLSGPPPTCRAVGLPHPDRCACEACKDSLLECARDSGCVAVSECRLERGCSGAECNSAATCAGVIGAHGGMQGQPARSAFAAETCLVNAGCEPRQFGYCR